MRTVSKQLVSNESRESVFVVLDDDLFFIIIPFHWMIMGTRLDSSSHTLVHCISVYWPKCLRACVCVCVRAMFMFGAVRCVRFLSVFATYCQHVSRSLLLKWNLHSRLVKYLLIAFLSPYILCGFFFTLFFLLLTLPVPLMMFLSFIKVLWKRKVCMWFF